MTRVALVSDTHFPRKGPDLPGRLVHELRRADLILHAGDLNTLELHNELLRFGPVHAVWGNNDYGDLRRRLPERVRLELEGLTVGLVHGHRGAGESTPERAVRSLPDVDVVVFGHSHRPLIAHRNGQLLVNPGSPTDRRSAPRSSCARLWLHEGAARAELVEW